MTALCYTAPSPSCVREVVTLLDGSLGRRCLECAVARPICHSFQVYNVLKLLKCGCATDDAKNSVVCNVINRMEVALCSPPSRTSTGGQTANWSKPPRTSYAVNYPNVWLRLALLHIPISFEHQRRLCVFLLHLGLLTWTILDCFAPPPYPALSTICWRRWCRELCQASQQQWSTCVRCCTRTSVTCLSAMHFFKMCQQLLWCWTTT